MIALLGVLAFLFGIGFGFSSLLYWRARVELKQHRDIENLEQHHATIEAETQLLTKQLRELKVRAKKETQEERARLDRELQSARVAFDEAIHSQDALLRERQGEIDSQLSRFRAEATKSEAEQRQRLHELQNAVQKFATILDTEKYIEEQQRRLRELQNTLSLLADCAALQAEISKRRETIENLRQELDAVEESLDIQSFGFYRPKHPSDSSEQLKTRLENVRDRQKRLVKDKTATHCPTEWIVGGSKADGRKMVGEQSKLMLRAFNGECDAAVAKVKYSNARTLETRITKSFEAINKMGETKHMWITRDYLNLKIEELCLVHEHAVKVQEEREEQQRIREQLREEEKVQREIEKAMSEAERDEDRAEDALESAKAELEHASAEQTNRLQLIVDRLEAQLKEALERKAKAIARAQLTRSGHVYVLSNIGSFGPDVVKIGMTRRLDPLERVYELGDASVPFRFDVHALLFSEDAPALESKLHRHFEDRRINRINYRREYFRASLDEVREAIAEHFGEVTFVTVPEAEEYRQTIAMLSEPSVAIEQRA